MTNGTWTPRINRTMNGIHGVTDPESIVPRENTIGRLYKGSPKRRIVGEDGKEKDIAGKELPYFRFESPRPEVKAVFDEAYGPEPKVINVILPFPTAVENFQTCIEIWKAGGLIHRCNGQVMRLWRDEKGVIHAAPPAEPKPCPWAGHPEAAPKDHRWVGRLFVIIPELLSAGFPGLVSLVTTSKNDDMSIADQLADIEEKRRLWEHTDWPLHYMRCTLRRVPKLLSSPNDEKEGPARVRRQHYMVEIEPVVHWVERQIEAIQEPLQLPEPPKQKPDWHDVSTKDQERKAQEEAAAKAAEVVEGEFTEEPEKPAGEPTPKPGPGDPKPANGNGPAGISAGAWLNKHALIVMALRERTGLQVLDLAAQLEARKASPSASIDDLVALLKAPPEAPAPVIELPAAVEPPVSPDAPATAEEPLEVSPLAIRAATWLAGLQAQVEKSGKRLKGTVNETLGAQLVDRLNALWPDLSPECVADLANQFCRVVCGKNIAELNFGQAKVLVDALGAAQDAPALVQECLLQSERAADEIELQPLEVNNG